LKNYIVFILALLALMTTLILNHTLNNEIDLLWAQYNSTQRQLVELRFRYDRIKDWADEYRNWEYANHIEMGGKE